jgi:hypothetical protein
MRGSLSVTANARASDDWQGYESLTPHQGSELEDRVDGSRLM